MIGTERTPTWTVLEQTVEAGQNKITLQREVDWKVGESIAIASTSFNGREAEERMITNIDNTDPTKPVLTLDRPLEFRHFADTETYGDVEIDMRAEVGLLSRQIVFRGDPETSK
jgi:cell migration-inducing and hyaluronan-binding protein